MQDTLKFITDNADGLLGILTAIVATASAINMVWGKPDNKWLGYAHKIVTWLALNVAKAKNKDA